MQDLAIKALTFETLGNYELARESYRELIQSSKSSQKIWSEGFVQCLENLCEWPQISEFVDGKVGNVTNPSDDIWSEAFMLRHFVTSKLNILAEEGKGGNVVTISFTSEK